MAAPTRLPPKKDVALALLEQSTVYVHLDPRSEGVRVPDWFKKQPQLVLQIGLNMPVPIQDLDVGDEAVSCTLSFSRRPHFCWIPWTSVFALVGENGRGMVWPEDVPKEVAAQAAQQQKKEAAPKLRAVPAEAKPAEGKPAEEEAKPKKKRARKTKSAEAVKTEAVKTEAVKKPKAASPRPSPAREAARPQRPEPALAQPSAASQASEGSSQASDSKPRRELPPYLRVIK
ncbi:MAG TPA: ClpXP protease specificity-enhancing factor SspB [Polyangiaceae bacterium]|jgi:stringent starvation protein B|nr:ClpXP protease specificity-enhancing factor SspB [Polyangiaceae bacterium]